MKTIGELRARILDELAKALECPALFACCSSDLAGLYWHRLGLLCFMDDRENELASEKRRLIQLRVHYPPTLVDGVGEALRQILPDIEDIYCEAASVYAEVAWRLGYFTVTRTLSAKQYAELVAFIGGSWDQDDWTPTQMAERFGPPSFVVGSDWVSCYASADPAQAWVCFDMPHGSGELIRSVRHTVRSLDAGLRLTPHGRSQTRRCPGPPELNRWPSSSRDGSVRSGA